MRRLEGLGTKLFAVGVVAAVGAGAWWFFSEPAGEVIESESRAVATVSPPAPSPTPAPAKPQPETGDEIDRQIGTFGKYEMRLHRSIVDLGGDHPEVSSWYEVIDVPAKRAVKLNELFVEAAIVEAAVAAIEPEEDPSDDYRSLKSAKSLASMKEALEKMPAELQLNTGDCDEILQLDFTTDNFAVVGFDSATGKADVHLGVFARSHLCKSIFPRLRLKIEVPPELRADLETAKAKSSLPTPESLRVCDTCDPVDVSTISLMGG